MKLNINYLKKNLECYEGFLSETIDVYIENPITRKKTKSNEAIYTFVAVDQNGIAIALPPLKPQTEVEKERYEAALRRRQLSLILVGKMKPEDATELKRLFA